jgi:DNA helicase-2/ATP-dependent DNA helicase PcrA
MKNSGGLNQQQQEVVEHTTGPMLVVAGAGTGKTRVIVERIAKLISGSTPPKRILALTFTEKAAAEMLDRANDLTGGYLLDLPVMTFNAYGESLLRRYGADIGLSRNFLLMGDSAQIVFLQEHLDSLGLDYYAPVSRPDGQLGALRDFFSKLKQLVITPDEFKKFADKLPSSDEAEKLEKKKNQELASAYDIYIELCKKSGVIDYDDQIYMCLELFNRRPNVLKVVQESYDFVMVDEFQDTNLMQSKLVDMLVHVSKNLLVVGDDDQSIYGFRGANLSNILNYKKRYPKSREVTLIQNYRSTKQILDCSYKLIKNNSPDRLEDRLGINKQLTSDKTGPSPAVHVFDRLNEELHWIAEDIQKRLQSGTPAGDIAILARRNATVKLLDDILVFKDIDHVVAGQRYELYNEPVVRTLLEALKTVVDPDNNVSLFHTLTGSLFNISPSTLTEALSQSRKEHEPLKKILDLSKDKILVNALEQIDSWRETSGISSVGRMAYQILDTTNYLKTLLKNARKDSLAATAVMRISEFFGTLKQFEQIAGSPSTVQYIESLPALIAAGNSGEDGTLDLSGDMVNVLTVHKAKGLEWPIVYIVDCTEKSFPLNETFGGISLPEKLKEKYYTEADEHIPEERRLMYVAMTRTRDELILTLSSHHSSQSARKPSRFINEAFDSENFINHAPTTTEVQPFEQFKPLNESPIKIPENILSGSYVSLTVSQVDTYLRCPLNFYYKYILKAPEEPNPSRDYGVLLHKVVEDINRSLISGTLVDLAELETKLNAEWPKAGYSSKLQRERALKQGLATLRQIYSRTVDNPEIPIAVEESFRISLDEYDLSVRGQLDAVFALGDSVEIRDYKTSTTVDTPERAKARAGQSEQLTLYALAWQIMHDELPSLVTLDFIDTGMRGSIKKTKRGIESAKLRLKSVADGIRNNAFPPGKDHDYCIHPDIAESK